MSYNVENLFDAIDDGEYQEDVTFLPLKVKKKWKTNQCSDKGGFYRKMCENLDWTQEKYEQKLQKISQVLLEYNDGVGADIIVLEELENKRVIEELWKKYLKIGGYNFPIHFESESYRGIDVGIISRFALKEPPLVHPVDLSDTPAKHHPTREIIEARFETKFGELRVAANHWPSQGNSVKARLKAATVLKKISEEASLNHVPFIATGDFNTLPQEVPNPIANNIADIDLKNLKRPLVDLQHFLYPNEAVGSYFYHGRWLPLDRFLVSKNLFEEIGSKDLFMSFEIFAPSYVLSEEYRVDPKTGKIKPFFVPKRYNFFTGEGYSDHLPIVMNINVSQK